MSEASRTRTGGQILIDQLIVHGVDTIFCVPGESYLAALDAMYDARDRMRLIVCRQEGGAAYMAEAYGKLTGRPGICFVTRGPGATNASSGLHAAYQDSTPMVVFIGQVPRAFAEREAFQEIDFRRMYAPLTKWVAQIEDAARIPEFVARAFTLAVSGRPGPVALALPEDMLCDRIAVADAAPYQVVQASPNPDQIERMRAMLAAARRPIMIVGGSTWTPDAVRDITEFATANRLPTATSLRCQDHFDNLHPCYAGDLGIAPNPKLAAMVENADIVLAVGPRLGEATTGGYTLFEAPRPHQSLIHVHAGTEELGRVYQAALPINAGMPQFAAAAKSMRPVDSSAWAGAAETAHRDYLAWGEPISNPGDVQLAEIVAGLRNRMPPGTIVTNGGGNFTGWVHRFWRFRELGTQLAPTNGSMGYGVPSGITAALLHTDRRVLSFSGDGCFLMNGQEIATANQYGVAPIFFVINNRMYGTIRMHQEREYPGRVIGSDLVNPDFAALARAYGLHGETVKRTGEFSDAFERCLNAGRAALIEIQLDPEALTTRSTLSGLRESSLRAGR